MRLKKIKCPVCGGRPRTYYEYFIGCHTYDAEKESGSILLNTVDTGETEDTVYVEAVCRECGHEWKLRGVKSLSDIQIR
jgi:ssDNA-binding Zn-finger/Zn-ribbon topoisomerase 1